MADIDLTYLEHNIRSRSDDVLRHASDLRPIYSRRSTTEKCYNLHPNDLIISRTTLIITLTFCGLLALSSLLVLATLLWKAHIRRLERNRAKTWGRQSRFYERNNKRISYASKGVDDEFTRKYRGVFSHTVVENPEMGSEEAVEMGLGKRGEVWEKDADTEFIGMPVVVDVNELEDVDLEEGDDVGATTRRYEVVDGRVRPKVPEKSAEKRNLKGRSLFWFESEGGHGVWMPKR